MVKWAYIAKKLTEKCVLFRRQTDRQTRRGDIMKIYNIDTKILIKSKLSDYISIINRCVQHIVILLLSNLSKADTK